MEPLATLFELHFTSALSEVSAGTFLMASSVFVIGLFLLAFYFASRGFGFHTDGTVIGAIQYTDTTLKNKSGKVAKRIQTTLSPVFEYSAQNGETRQTIGSEGGSSTLKYETGQAVNLVVREDSGYDDVYDADKRGALHIGLLFSALGAGLMVFVGGVAWSLGIGAFFLSSLALAYLISAVVGRVEEGRRFDRSPSSASNAQVAKMFEARDVYPIEYFKHHCALAVTSGSSGVLD